MQATELTGLSITRAAELIEARAVSPLELTEAYLRRIEALNPRINAYVTVTADRAREDARRATDEIAAGEYRGPLHGIPVALKDLFDTAGIATTGGAKIFAGRVPDKDSAPARRLREAGSVLLGKLNTHELAYGGTTNNPQFGPTRNPWNLDYIPGGSSGGSGAAIAAGLAAGTLGTDTGGSIRIPASLCGCVGLKPTYGRISKAGVLPLSWMFDHPGPITHTVEDAALMLNVLAGYDPDDFATVPVPVEDYTADLREDIVGLRVGIPRAYFFDRLDDEVRAAVERAIVVLKDLGAEIHDPVDLGDVNDLYWAASSVFGVEGKEIHAQAIRERPADFGADVYRALTLPDPSAVEMAAMLRRTWAGTERMRRALEDVDVLVTPTSCVPAAPIGEEMARYGGPEGRETRLILLLARNTAPFNGARLPALSVPCGFTASGLPIGLQIAGRPFDEATVLRAGYAYEQATDWHTRHPGGLG